MFPCESLYEKILHGEEVVSVIGLGYVGISTANAFSKKVRVVGFDLDEDKIRLYKEGIDPTCSLGDDEIRKCGIEFTHDEARLKDAKFHVIAVPTPVREDNTPDLSLIENACVILGRNLTTGSIVVIESTVYPGMTEETCIPLLEKASSLTCGVDFKVGYSPERINPGDKVHRFENIKKIVSGMDGETLGIVSKMYSLVVEAGVHPAESIKVAEAAKVVENAQRDINIAFMNELSVIFGKMGIDTKAVLEAAGTKWNFLKFIPGLVGGQCIGVDPYYLIHQARRCGYESKVILAGREVNDMMGKYVGERFVLSMAKADKRPEGSKVIIMGFTFKENFPDIRNTKVYDIVKTLAEYGITPLVYDPVADAQEVKSLYGITLCKREELKDADGIIFAVSHNEFLRYTFEEIDSFYKENCEKKVIFDVKGILEKSEFEKNGYVYGRL